MARSSMLFALAIVLLAGVRQAHGQARDLLATSVELDTTFNVLIRCGDERPDPSGKKMIKLGQVVDQKWRPILDAKGEHVNTGNADFTSYHQTPKGVRAVVQMETSPAPYFVMGVEQDSRGHMRVNTLELVDVSEWEGSVRPCAGSVTSWNTHLGGEESYPDVKAMTEWLNTNNIDKVAGSSDVRNLLNWHGYYLGANTTDDEYLKGNCSAIGVKYIPPTAEGKAEWFKLFKTIYKPFMIGHVFEIDVRSGGKPKYVKHLALGRSSWELALVMPDDMTVYLTDDAVAGGFTKFVADKKGDLSKGTLYAAKFKQTSKDNSTDDAAFTLTWIKLSKVDQSIVEKEARKPLSEFNFDSIFLSAPFNVSCPEGYKRIDWQFTECLKLNTATPNVEMLAAALETRRYIPYVGATTEFSKMEGLTYDAQRKKLYMAISYQRNLMTTELPAGGQNDVRVKENVCGCVYALDVDEKYVAKNMYVEYCGKKITVNGTDSCDISSTSNPDNLDMMDGYNWLIVSEDTDYRVQDLLQVHDVVTKKNVIIASAETTDSEVTAGYFSNVGEYSYVTFNYQGFDTSPIGYLGPYKLKGVKSVSWKPHTPKGPDYVNPYAPFKASKPAPKPKSKPAPKPGPKPGPKSGPKSGGKSGKKW